MMLWCFFSFFSSFHEVLVLAFGMFILVSLVIKCSCMTPLSPIVIVVRGFTF